MKHMETFQFSHRKLSQRTSSAASLSVPSSQAFVDLRSCGDSVIWVCQKESDLQRDGASMTDLKSTLFPNQSGSQKSSSPWDVSKR